MSLIVPAQFEGAPGRAQGGYTGGLFHDGLPRRAWFRSAIPLDTPLDVSDDGETISVSRGETLVLESHRTEALDSALPSVTMDQAITARERTESAGLPDLISTCYSCGTGEESLRIHPGEVEGSEVWATPIVFPEWTAREGVVAPNHVWAVVDCAPGYTVTAEGGRMAFTGWLTVDVRSNIEPGAPAVVVASADPWDGRKRLARSALWTDEGDLVALAESLWISVHA